MPGTLMSPTSISIASRAFRPRNGVIWSRISRLRSRSSNGPRQPRTHSRRCVSRYVCHTWIDNAGRFNSRAPTKGCWPRSPAMLTLAFDTATSAATSALVRGEEVLAEGVSRAVRVLADAEELLGQAGAKPSDVRRLVVGTGPGSFTGVRMGLAAARSLAFALDLPLAGVSTLHALAAGAPGSLPVIDAGRREVFTMLGGRPAVLAPAELRLQAGTVGVRDGAVRYREVLESLGAEVPPRDSELHLPKARFHARLATDFIAPDEVEPLYLRLPDAEEKR